MVRRVLEVKEDEIIVSNPENELLGFRGYKQVVPRN